MISSSNATGRLAVVTGSNKGIGYFIALQLGLSGLFSDIILGCRDATRGQQAVESIQASLSASKDAPKVSYLPLELGNSNSYNEFRKQIETKHDGKIDVLVNNAAFAFKNADPTPFQDQTKPTLDINFRSTIEFTECMLPLIRKGNDPRIVNVASMSGRLSQVSPRLQKKFASDDLTMDQLKGLIDQFEDDVNNGCHRKNGWSNTNYGMSKLGVIAATKVWSRTEAKYGISVNCCCPGSCKTDMSSQRGFQSAEQGAKNAVIPATMKNPPSGEFFENFDIGQW